jgi:hypothetical protein
MDFLFIVLPGYWQEKAEPETGAPINEKEKLGAAPELTAKPGN